MASVKLTAKYGNQYKKAIKKQVEGVECSNPSCRHKFKPRKNVEKPVCPKCHRAI